MKERIRRVHVVFKTHLDIGFTDLAAQVVDKYMLAYIPKAMDLAGELERSGGQAQFVWTTGSWLIDEYLRREDTDHERMLRAIGKGQIVWHGMPFTTHTELLDASLLEYGLSIAGRLDARFGRRTIAAKMTDVPGHTIGMVDALAAAGIRYLHLGVNPASRVPEVPPLFRWRTATGREVIVNYADDYGGQVDAAGIGEVLVFAHTGDNLGPPEADTIRRLFASLESQYPGAEVRASTMDDYAAALLEMDPELPVVNEEIGDTWIHGTASDPWKLAAFPASWEEQRGYLREALSALPQVLRTEAERELAELQPQGELPQGEEPLEAEVEYSLGCFRVRFDHEGAIELLEDRHGRIWAQPDKRLGVVSYETFGPQCYERWHREYMRNREVTHSWSEADFGKPGLEFAVPPAAHGLYRPRLDRLCAVREDGHTRVYAQLCMPAAAVRDNGAPAVITLEYRFTSHDSRLGLTVHWVNKPGNRKPEAVWLGLNPSVACPGHWGMHKTGSWLSPQSVVRGGNRHLHAVQTGVRYAGYDGTVLIRTLDAALAAPGAGRLLRSDDRFADLEGGWHFLLSNNVWGTNFPMWQEGNAKFRFWLEFA
ncbi:MAG: glycoside hydrolase [Paenibacillaceae bacterium]|jgi:hypothetical protein|nr:glycoside hydrolase [Paenibacillaceae bacterium]